VLLKKPPAFVPAYIVAGVVGSTANAVPLPPKGPLLVHTSALAMRAERSKSAQHVASVPRTEGRNQVVTRVFIVVSPRAAR
jgi:hypothetical protein